MADQGVDLLLRATVHTLVPGQQPQRALATRGDRIIALSDDPLGLDELATARTKVIDEPDATVLPAFDDTHTHLIFAGHSAHERTPLVPRGFLSLRAVDSLAGSLTTSRFTRPARWQNSWT